MDDDDLNIWSQADAEAAKRQQERNAAQASFEAQKRLRQAIYNVCQRRAIPEQGEAADWTRWAKSFCELWCAAASIGRGELFERLIAHFRRSAVTDELYKIAAHIFELAIQGHFGRIEQCLRHAKCKEFDEDGRPLSLIEADATGRLEPLMEAVAEFCRKLETFQPDAESFEPPLGPLPPASKAVQDEAAAGPLHAGPNGTAINMLNLRDSRIARLHKAFLDAADKYGELHFAVVTPHDGADWGWPEVPRQDRHRSFGIEQWLWRELEHKKRDEFFADLQTYWLRFRGRLWQGTFFNGGPAADPGMLYQEELHRLRGHLDDGLAEFAKLAIQAAGHFALHDIDTRTDHPRTQGLAARWLEFVCLRLLDPTDEQLYTVNFKRLPGDVFMASAHAIERFCEAAEPAEMTEAELDALLEAAMRDNEADFREHVRQFWIECCGMPPGLDYWQGAEWAKQKQARDDAERANWQAKRTGLERRIEVRLRDRLLGAGFRDDELQPGLFVRCMPKDVHPSDSRYEAYKTAMHRQGEEYKAMLRALGCKGDPETEQARESKARGGILISTLGELIACMGNHLPHYYTLKNGVPQFRPNEVTMPGIGRIEIICDREWGSPITEDCLRKLRGCVAVKLGFNDPAQVDAIVLAGVADAFDGLSYLRNIETCPNPWGEDAAAVPASVEELLLARSNRLYLDALQFCQWLRDFHRKELMQREPKLYAAWLQRRGEIHNANEKLWILLNWPEPNDSSFWKLAGKSPPAERPALERLPWPAWLGKLLTAITALRVVVLRGGGLWQSVANEDPKTSAAHCEAEFTTAIGNLAQSLDEARIVLAGRQGSSPAATGTRMNRKRGRKPLTDAEAKGREELIARWLRAKEVGITQKDFCEDEDITRRELDRAINWQSTRSRRKVPKRKSRA